MCYEKRGPYLLGYQAHQVQGQAIVVVQPEHLIEVEVQPLKHDAEMISMCEVLIHSNDVQFAIRVMVVIQELENVGFKNCLIEVCSLVLDDLDRHFHTSLQAGTQHYLAEGTTSQQRLYLVPASSQSRIRHWEWWTLRPWEVKSPHQHNQSTGPIKVETIRDSVQGQEWRGDIFS